MPRSILETHHKSHIVLASFFVTVAGWWAWNGFLSSIYAPGVSVYAVRNGFTQTFGRDAVWWSTLWVVLMVLFLLELCAKTLKRNLVVAGLWKWPTWRRRDSADGMVECDVELWQELEKDPVVRERLRMMARDTGGTASFFVMKDGEDSETILGRAL